ncbi:hypothetical protein MNBD_UNCLBAC01-1048 [hydrothermal vent metagenome]|uniref:Uncharacterized protein n=1 Tax=hydrothermal vent metagenome TaxID=652676 RepID=A0A3B1DIF6_9ZZZZ
MYKILKIEQWLIFITLILSPLNSFANDCQYSGESTIQNMIARVERINIKQNFLYVINEQTLNTNSFFVARRLLQSLKKGDRIRIYYRCGNNALISFKKMTVIKYNKETSNRGYILKKK